MAPFMRKTELKTWVLEQNRSPYSLDSFLPCKTPHQCSPCMCFPFNQPEKSDPPTPNGMPGFKTPPFCLPCPQRTEGSTRRSPSSSSGTWSPPGTLPPWTSGTAGTRRREGREGREGRVGRVGLFCRRTRCLETESGRLVFFLFEFVVRLFFVALFGGDQRENQRNAVEQFRESPILRQTHLSRVFFEELFARAIERVDLNGHQQ